MSDTGDMIAFYRERLDEEAAAIEAPETWTAFEENEQTGTRRVDVDYSIERVTACTLSWRGEHIARQDPARTLKRIEAQREVIRLAERAHDFAPTFTSGFGAAMEQALRLFVVAYDGHPDYRAVWRP
ncbi:DUF6221 family protein [Streptomyces sp. NPDC005244]|uniref:DUF6221 family protein n=1 Tax=Streptomyces sp. NPDC005244 TaxID=3364708 RepID=UPI0036C28A8D